jgi:hypothetical protein
MTLTMLCSFPRLVVVYQMYIRTWMDLRMKECKPLDSMCIYYLTRSYGLYLDSICV